MKSKFFFAAGLLFFMSLAACQSDQDNESEHLEKAENLDPTTIEFEKTEHNFGVAQEGDKVEHSFEFTNTGDKNLVIVDATGSCGCTVPEFPKEPIAPGQKGKIDVVFNSENRPGEVKKSVTVIANTVPTKTTLYLVGKVE